MSWNQVFDYFLEIKKELSANFSLTIPFSKKGFMLALKTNCRAKVRDYVIQKYLGQSYNLIKHRSGRYVKMSEIDEYLGN